MTWGEEEPYEYVSPEDKAASDEDIAELRENNIREHRESLFSIREEILNKIKAYNDGVLGDKEFYSGMIVGSVRLGSCQKKYNFFSSGLEEQEGLAREIEKVILDGLLNKKDKFSG